MKSEIFVKGFGTLATEDSLRNYFSLYGEVTEGIIVRNDDGKSRGFGFVTFKNPDSVNAVLQSRPHEINGQRVTMSRRIIRIVRSVERRAPSTHGEVFLGGLPPDVTERDIRSSFSKFGQINKVTIMWNHRKRKCRGYGFLSFEHQDSIDEACAERFVNIKGKRVECKRSEPAVFNQRRNPAQELGSDGQNGRTPTPEDETAVNQPTQPYYMQGATGDDSQPSTSGYTRTQSRAQHPSLTFILVDARVVYS
ncbi:unnamed protein product, partial [Larinioides sclopetarius]